MMCGVVIGSAQQAKKKRESKEKGRRKARKKQQPHAPFGARQEKVPATRTECHLL